MRRQQKTFGQTIREAREKIRLNQKQLAALIKKEDGQAISAPYLNDIEHDRRTPTSDHIIGEFARELNLPAEVLYFAARTVPPSFYKSRHYEERLLEACEAFKRTLDGDAQAA